MFKSAKGGVIVAHNTSNTPQLLVPSEIAQAGHPDFIPRIPPPSADRDAWVEQHPTYKGNATLPLAWRNPNIRFEIVRLPHSLAVGDRELANATKWTTPGSTWTMKELVSAVKAAPEGRAPGPDNPKNYMGFDRTNWKEFAADMRRKVPAGVMFVRAFRTSTASSAAGYECTSDEIAYMLTLGETPVAVVVPREGWVDYDAPNDSLERFLNSIGTSGCISLLQKIVRRRPARLGHPDTGDVYPAPTVLARIVRRMCCGVQSGIFLPNIGKHVTALQHFLKRTFVISAEDSMFSNHTSSAALIALLASEMPVWVPDAAMVNALEMFVVSLWQSDRTSDYKTDQELPLPARVTARSAPCFVHHHMGGMHGDQQMLRWLASRPINAVSHERHVDVDSLDVYCDQHQDGRLACLMPPKFPVARLLQIAFDKVSGRNPRRIPPPKDARAETIVVDALAFSSRMLRRIARKDPAPPKPAASAAAGSASSFDYTLHEGAVAGMVGQLVVKHNRKLFYATLCSRDMSTVVVLKPTRAITAKTAKIDHATKEAVAGKAHGVWRSGVRATNVVEKAFAGSTLRRTADGEWAVLFHGDAAWTSWADARRRRLRLQKTPEWAQMTARQAPWPWVGNAGSGGAWGNGKTQTFDAACVQFVVGRMKSYDHTVTIPKISREGKGVDEALSGLEVAGYQLCVHLSELFPDALWPSATIPFGFDTACVPFRHTMCERLLAAAPGSGSAVQWPAWRSELTLTPYQSAALTDMRVAWEKKFASFLWMLVGQGKTLTVLTYLHQTAATDKVVWALPKTAIASVAQQIRDVGWPCVLLCKSKGTAKTRQKSLRTKCPGLDITTDAELRPRHVTLVEHDMLRDLVDALAPQMTQVAFVFDEVHKAMAGTTKRTAVALRLAKLSKQLVALTGTPIVTKEAHGLREWLKLCVPFPVSGTNFWVAANSMVTHLNTGKIVVVEREDEAPHTAEQTAYFNENFPKRSPWNGNTETPTEEAWRDMQRVSLGIADEYIVELAADMFRNHPDDDWQQDHARVLARQDANDFDESEELAAFSKRPVVVAANRHHAVALVGKLLGQGVGAQHILSVGGAAASELLAWGVDHAPTVHLTEAAVRKGDQKPYRVVVAPIQFCEGYSLTWMTHMISGVYPSNQASRSQMRGRIARLDAQRKHKTYITVLAGVTRVTYRHQEAAKQMERALGNAAHAQ